ncbi:hypothetical protein I317_00744 [Kwoniella heveanensis CBS 569]|nr:hypothetical protein I317_00744 [Kwoniella heveanensis CBS 569]
MTSFTPSFPQSDSPSATPTPQNPRPPSKQRNGRPPQLARKSKGSRRAPGSIDLPPLKAQTQQSQTAYPPPIYPPLPLHPADVSLQVGMTYPTRFHPHLRHMWIYVNSFPPDIEEGVLADALRGCLPVRIKLDPAVPEEARLLPDMHYDWMPRSAERALAILADHTIFAPRGVWFSPHPPPHILPLPESPASTRYIRPTKLALAPTLPPNPSPEQSFRAYVPTPAEVYDAVRPWGSIRSVNSYLQQAAIEGKQEDPTQGHLWMARVEFWYEDEASRFETGFGQACNLLKGWQIYIHGIASQSTAVPPVSAYQVPPRMLPPVQPQTYLPPTPESVHFLPPAMETVGDLSAQQMGVMYLGPNSLPATPLTASIPIMPNMPVGVLPHTPPAISYAPPWASHNIFAGAGYIPEGHVDHSPMSSPVTPQSMRRRMSRASMSSLHARQRTWSLTVGESPDGELRPTGLVADDGTVIQHGPGQHIRPAPAYGPGSSSVSGLVDYSNVFVKNLDPDINSYFLEELFSKQVGQVVSARVMRDEQGRSRCYGFVSFHLPEQAAKAINTFHDTVVGKSRISVTLHEPRKLRSEKMVERSDVGLPSSFGRHPAGAPRRSMSPVRNERMGRRRSAEPSATGPNSTENLRLLSPGSRKTALIARVSSRVRMYAQTNEVEKDQVEPVIEALVKLDLSLIPLLHDRPQLDQKIGQAFEQLHIVKPAEAESDLSKDLNFSPAPLSSAYSKLRPTDAELVQLREEVEKIDPANVNEIIPVILEMLDPADWDKLWVNAGVAKKYGEAKLLLASQEDRTQVNTSDEDQLAKVIEVAKPSNDSDQIADLDSTRQDDSAIPLEGLTIASLAVHPANTIIGHLQGKNGPAIHQQLGLVEPTNSEKNGMESWLSKVMKKSKVERGVEVAGLLGKKIDIDTLKRSQKLKVIRDLINADADDEALCRL